jgi:hypothetical protein
MKDNILFNKIMFHAGYQGMSVGDKTHPLAANRLLSRITISGISISVSLTESTSF